MRLLKSHPMNTLKQQLILSLQALDLYKKSEDLRDATKLLDQFMPDEIPNEEQEKEIFGFIWELVNKYPEVMHDLNNNQQLKAFCSKLTFPESEMKAKLPFNKSK